MYDETAEFEAITDSQGLWRLLLSRPNGPALPPAVAIEVFRRVHNTSGQGADDSALLLCTDRRWHRTSAQVLAGILETALLDEPGTDRLAADLLWPDTVQYKHPAGLIGSAFVEIDLTQGEKRP